MYKTFIRLSFHWFFMQNEESKRINPSNIGRIVETKADEQGFVLSVKVKIVTQGEQNVVKVLP